MSTIKMWITVCLLYCV